MPVTCLGCSVKVERGADGGYPAACPSCGKTLPVIAPPGGAAIPASRARPASAVAAGARRTRASADLSVGRVFAESLSLWGRNLLPFTALTVAVYSPLLLYTVVTVAGGEEGLTQAEAERYDNIQNFVGRLLGSLVAGAIVYGVFERLRGKSPTLQEMFAKGIGRLFPVLWTAILAFVVTVLPLVPGFLVVAAGGLAMGSVLMLGGLVGVVMVGTALAVALPAAVVEKCNGLPALKRSLELTKGARGRIFLIQMLVGIVGALYAVAVQNMVGFEARLILLQCFVVLSASFSAVFSTVIYYRLRADREGIGIEEFASVFD